MNLQNLNVQEMNAQELLAIDGGGWLDDVADTVGYAVAVGVAVATVAVAVHIVADAIVDH